MRKTINIRLDPDGAIAAESTFFGLAGENMVTALVFDLSGLPTGRAAIEYQLTGMVPRRIRLTGYKMIIPRSMIRMAGNHQLQVVIRRGSVVVFKSDILEYTVGPSVGGCGDIVEDDIDAIQQDISELQTGQNDLSNRMDDLNDRVETLETNPDPPDPTPTRYVIGRFSSGSSEVYTPYGYVDNSKVKLSFTGETQLSDSVMKHTNAVLKSFVGGSMIDFRAVEWAVETGSFTRSEIADENGFFTATAGDNTVVSFLFRGRFGKSMDFVWEYLNAENLGIITNIITSGSSEAYTRTELSGSQYFSGSDEYRIFQLDIQKGGTFKMRHSVNYNTMGWGSVTKYLPYTGGFTETPLPELGKYDTLDIEDNTGTLTRQTGVNRLTATQYGANGFINMQNWQTGEITRYICYFFLPELIKLGPSPGVSNIPVALKFLNGEESLNHNGSPAFTGYIEQHSSAGDPMDRYLRVTMAVDFSVLKAHGHISTLPTTEAEAKAVISAFSDLFVVIKDIAGAEVTAFEFDTSMLERRKGRNMLVDERGYGLTPNGVVLYIAQERFLLMGVVEQDGMGSLNGYYPPDGEYTVEQRLIADDKMVTKTVYPGSTTPYFSYSDLNPSNPGGNFYKGQKYVLLGC